ncbi:hypothetical protein, partial [Legionella sp. 28fT52]|uniref:hypothetical protein n=1 Tax=Legionella sp. 28fT52 TaxID=3410134 RepID=UPI003AF69830
LKLAKAQQPLTYLGASSLIFFVSALTYSYVCCAAMLENQVISAQASESSTASHLSWCFKSDFLCFSAHILVCMLRCDARKSGYKCSSWQKLKRLSLILVLQV